MFEKKTWHLNWFLATRVMQTMGTSLKLAHPGKWFLMNLFRRFSCILNQIISSEQVHWWSKKLPDKPRKHRMSRQPFRDVVIVWSKKIGFNKNIQLSIEIYFCRNFCWCQCFNFIWSGIFFDPSLIRSMHHVQCVFKILYFFYCSHSLVKPI